VRRLEGAGAERGLCLGASATLPEAVRSPNRAARSQAPATNAPVATMARPISATPLTQDGVSAEKVAAATRAARPAHSRIGRVSDALSEKA
jgi:hypothetical protein